MRKPIKRAFVVACAASLLMLTAVSVRGASSSTNYALDFDMTPVSAGDAFSTNFHLVGMIPQDPSGEVRISANYQLDTTFVPDTFEPVDTTPPIIQSGPTVTYLSDTSAVIEWTTDEPADGVADYGLTVSYGSTQNQTTGFTTLHQVHLTGLTAGTLYNYRVSSTDPYSNGPTQSANATFTTLGTPDTTPPGIAETVTATSTTSVDIDFTTTESASSDVAYGPTAALGTNLPDPVFRTTHTRAIAGLTPGGTLFYEVTATDPSANSSNTGVQTFTMPDDVAITTTTLPNGTVGDVYSQLLAATGGVGAITWSMNSGTLPNGLALISSTGEISGIPSGDGLWAFSVRATDSGTPASTTVVSLQITVDSGGGGGGGDDGGGCSTTDTPGWLYLLALLGALSVFALRARRA